MRRRLIPLFLILVLSAAGVVAVLVTDSSPYLGLDLQGGLSVVLEPTSDATDDQLDQAVSIIRDRVDALGVAEPEITRQGDAVVVQLPGLDDEEDRDRVVDLIGTTAELRFRPVLSQPVEAPEDEEESEESEESAEQAAQGEDQGGDQETTSYCGVEEPTPPSEDEQQNEGEETTPELTPPAEDLASQPVTLEDTEGGLIYSLGPTPCFAEGENGELTPNAEGDLLATGRVVEDAEASLNDVGQWEIRLKMRSGAEGIDLFNQIAVVCSPVAPTAECPTSQLAIVLDSTVQSAPRIQPDPETGQTPVYERDQIVISGSPDPETGEGGFSEGEAKDLARLLRYGALPVVLEQQSLQTVSATLGEDSLRAGVVAGIVGVILVVLYMTFYYRALGLVVVAGMALWAALLYTMISWLGTTQGLALTLAGVTGIIISVGVMVDSYIVYFERLKDDVRLGRAIRTSVDRSFKPAFRTIVAANTATFIGAVVLWWWTVGAVRGFAFFLGLSTVLGVLVTALYTRPMVTLLARSRFFTEARAIGIAHALAAPPGSAEAASTGGTR